MKKLPIPKKENGKLIISIEFSIHLLTDEKKKISTSLPPEGGGKNEISTDFHRGLDKQKTPLYEEVIDDKMSVARNRIELPTQGFSVLCPSLIYKDLQALVSV